MSSNQHSQFWVTCPQGVHPYLKQEIQMITGREAFDWHKGVSFKGELVEAYQFCLWSRLANRVYLALGESSEVSSQGLESLVKDIQWDEFLRPSGSLKVQFNGFVEEIRDSRFGAQKVKDWVVDQFRERHGSRPSVDADPDARIFVQIASKKLFVGLEMTSESLHKRGYRESTGPAPIKENLAAALLYAMSWPELARQGKSFLDLMCGSGTLVVEAAMIAADYAPGLGQREFGFERWLTHDRASWISAVKEARERRAAGVDAMPAVMGYDSDGGVVATANRILKKLGLSQHSRCYQRPVSDWQKPTHWQLNAGVWVSNPPYGERLGEKPKLLRMYRMIGQVARKQLPDWHVGILTSDDTLAREIGLRPSEKRQFYNGRIPTTLYQYSADEPREKSSPSVIDEQAEYFKNRLLKNQKRLSNWVKKENVEAYRLYDADLPEFAVAVDKYGDWLHVQEYAPPKSVAPEKANQRLLNAIDVLSETLNVPIEKIVVKRREKQKGKKQYEKHQQTRDSFWVTENTVRLKVNLKAYLDTGLFLDHRPMRFWLQQRSSKRSLLNLFCYTGSFSAHAAKGGASRVVSVDLSKTYLAWAKENLLENLDNKWQNQHEFIHADCLDWLKQNKEKFDFIVMDPPTFSNSARMSDTLDIQRDHIELVQDAMRSLKPEGTLVFSNNFKRFKLDSSLSEQFHVKDFTKQSIAKDFERKQPHHCFLISHKEQR